MTVLATRRTGNAGTLPFLLLHAMPLDSTMWDLVRDRLAPIDVVTVDAPGFGGSPSGAELQERYGRPEPSLEAFVEAIPLHWARSCRICGLVAFQKNAALGAR